MGKADLFTNSKQCFSRKLAGKQWFQTRQSDNM